MTNEAYEQIKLFNWVHMREILIRSLTCCIMYQMVAREIKKRLLILSVKECVQVYRICVCRLQEENFTHFTLNSRWATTKRLKSSENG